jgi:hypothetical protein
MILALLWAHFWSSCHAISNDVQILAQKKIKFCPVLGIELWFHWLTASSWFSGWKWFRVNSWQISQLSPRKVDWRLILISFFQTFSQYLFL